MKFKYPEAREHQYEDPLAGDDPFDLRKWKPTAPPSGTAPMGSLGQMPKMAGGGEIDSEYDPDPTGIIAPRPDPIQAPQRVSSSSDLQAVPPLEHTRRAAEIGTQLEKTPAPRPGIGRTIGAIASDWFLSRRSPAAAKAASDAIINSDPKVRAYNDQQRQYGIESELANQERQGAQVEATAGWHKETAKTRAAQERANELKAYEIERKNEEAERDRKTRMAADEVKAKSEALRSYGEHSMAPAPEVPYQLAPSVDLPPVAPPPGEMPLMRQPPVFTPGQTRGTTEDLPNDPSKIVGKDPLLNRTIVKRGDEIPVDQYNRMLQQRWSVLHPAEPIPDAFRLPPGATQKDFDRIEKALSGTEGAEGTKASRDNAAANQKINQDLHRTALELARQNKTDKADNAVKKDAYKAFTPAMDSAERLNVMTKNYEEAVKNHDQQAMLSLLANHLGMTMGLQKGARLTKDIVREAEHSRPWLQGMAAKFDSNGYLAGVTLTPEQMRQMVSLGRERFSEDISKARNESKYLGASDDGPKRSPNRSTINHYLGLTNGDLKKAKQLASEDGWSVE